MKNIKKIVIQKTKIFLIDEKCSFSDKKMKGGYECNDEGNWDFSSCIPSYCDNGYVFDKREKKCIEDICINQRKIEINNVKKDKIYKTLIIIFSVLLFLSIALFLTISFSSNRLLFKSYFS